MTNDSPKAVIVTGAASGIGFACVQGLLAAGHRVCGADIQPVPVERLANHSSNFIAAHADVSNAADCRKAVDQTIEKFGALTSLIHMAAAHSTLTWQELTAEHFTRIMAVNVTGAFLIAQAAAERMAAGSAIVLTSSGTINSGGVGGHGRGGPAYVSSKAAIVGLTRSLARSLGPQRIRVNAIAPGATKTAMTADYDEDAMRKVGERVLLGHMGEPDDIADVAQFLISDASRYMTGDIVNVNGGGSFG